MGVDFQKRTLPTFLQFVRARAAHQPHVISLFYPRTVRCSRRQAYEDESFSHMLKYAFNHFNLSGLEKVEVDGTG